MSFYKVMYLLVLMTISLFVAQKLMNIQNEEAEKELVSQANEEYVNDIKNLPQDNEKEPNEREPNEREPENNTYKKQDIIEDTKIQPQEQNVQKLEESEYIILSATTKDNKHYFILEDRHTEQIHLEEITKDNYNKYTVETE